MATIRKRGTRWRVEISKNGVRASGSFATKAAALEWAAHAETEAAQTGLGAIPKKTFGELLDEYLKKVSPAKRGHRWERVRIAALQSDPVCKVMLADLRAPDFAAWRDRRLRVVSAATVLREWNLLSHACSVAVREWHWLRENPLREVKRPPEPKPRDRRIGADELDRLLFALGYDYAAQPITQSARVGAALLFAIETAMRAGELCGLAAADIDVDRQTATLEKTKNGTTRRVPLSREAVRIIKQLPLVTAGTPVFGLTTGSLDALFRKAKTRAVIADLHFHDSRHEAITRLAKKIPVMDLARMVGHRDLKQLLVYYNETAEEIASKLD